MRQVRPPWKKFTQVASREFAPFGITVNCIGPTPVSTDLIRAVPKEKINILLESQAIKRLGRKRRCVKCN